MDFVITPGAVHCRLGVDCQEPKLVQLGQLSGNYRCLFGWHLIAPRKGTQLIRAKATEQ